MENDTIIQNIRQKAERYLEEQLELLKRLVSVDCGTGNLDGNSKVAEMLGPILSGLGGRLERHECPLTGLHLVTRLGRPGAGKKILCLAHLDTIFAEGEAKRHPFRTEGEVAYGLGIADCKGGVVVSIYGLKIAIELGLISEEVEITVIYNSDEEIGSPYSRKIIQAEAKGAQLALVFEPARSSDSLITHCSGIVSGYLEVIGTAAPLPIRTSSDIKVAIWRISESMESHDDPSRGVSFHLLFPRHNLQIEDTVKELTVNFIITFDDDAGFKYIKETLEKIVHSSWAPETRLSAKFEVRPPSADRTDKTLQAYTELLKVGRELGHSFNQVKPLSSTDGYLCAFHGLPVIDSLGPTMGQIHKVDESLLISSLREKTELFALYLSTL
ncbi:MAG: M20/M25/M40 family metallo-hydrolase [Deltaproteobacteria bacterium]|jgi:glutamate carboxypeptidase|nr:M20/M25/M40 family metallo-hydrolase [Deltaproteobacteria bacterium]